MVEQAQPSEDSSFPHSELRQRPRWERRRLASLARRCRRRGGAATRTAAPEQKVLFEPLEPRYLLSADLMPFAIDMADYGNDLTLMFDEASETLKFLNNLNGNAVVAQGELKDISKVVVKGTDSDDRLVVDFTVNFFLPNGIHFAGDTGADSLVISAGQFHTVAYTMTDALAGRAETHQTAQSADAGAIYFTGLSQLLDFTIAQERSFADATGTGQTIRLADDGEAGNGLSLIQDGAGTGFGTEIVFASPTSLLTIDAGDGDDVVEMFGLDSTLTAQVVLIGGAGNDTLIGPDGDNSWWIEGLNSGQLNDTIFESFENLVGGAGNDTFYFVGGSISGTIEGGGGTNVLDYSAQTNSVTVDLAAGAASHTGGFADIHQAVGGGGDNTLVGRDSDTSWQITGPDSGLAGDFAFTDFANVLGGSGDDSFMFHALGSLAGVLDGGLGDDTLFGPDQNNIWTITGASDGMLNDTAFTGIELLRGGLSDDDFIIAYSGLVALRLAGGQGNDRLRGADRANAWRLTAPKTGTLNDMSFSEIDELIGGSDIDTLYGPADDEVVWTIDGPDSGEVAGTRFAGMENLEGAADNEDTFVFTAAGSLSGLVEGGDAGFDSIVLEGNFATLEFLATGPDSGTITRNGGDVITYAGMEPITVVGEPDDVVLTFSSGPQTITISNHGVAGQIIVESTQAELHIFNVPANSLTINASNSVDTIILNALDPTFNADLTINAGDGDDIIFVNAITGSGTYTINGGAGDDTIFVERDEDMTLSDSELVVGAQTIALSSIDVADLRGGVSANTFTISDWSGVARIDGGPGDDVYKFGDGSVDDSFGTVELTNQPGEGTDTIDFTGHAGTLHVSQTHFANDTITSSDGSTLIQLGTLAEEIDATLAGGSAAALSAFLDELLEFVERLQGDVEGVAQLLNQLPLIDTAEDGGVAKLANLTGAFTEFVTKAKTAIGALVGDVTLSDVVGVLDNLVMTLGSFTALSLGVSTSYRGEHISLPDAGRIELLLDFQLLAEIDHSFALHPGDAIAGLGLDFTAMVDIDIALDAQFSIGFSTPPVGLPDVFLVPGGTITLAVDAAADLTGQSATLGFLDITFDTGLITLEGELEVTLTDFTGDGRVDLTQSIGSLTTVAASGTIDAAADISVAPGVLVGALDLSLASLDIDFEMALTTASNPFGTLTESSQAKITKLDATFGSPEITINLLNFGNISTNEVLGMLGGVLDAFSALVSSQVMQVPIPFANKTVGDILNYSKSFKEEVLDPLFVSGDFSNPDASGPGGVPDGIVDHHDLHFGSIQTLVARLDDALGLIDLKADYNHLINELSFTIDFNRAFGLGHGNVITITQGVEGTTEEEQQLSFPAATATLTQKVPGNHTVQILTLRNAVKGNYTLALGASTTAPIAFNAAASGTGSVEARLNAALGAAGPVSVTLVSAANGTRVYEITFAADPGQMLVANTEPAGAAKLQGPVEAFRLAFRDDAGNLQVTGVIDATATPAAMEAAIKAQLEALGDIGSDNVTVAHGGIVEHRRLFNITFDDTLGNVAQLGFAGELALNFGQALGDFASISTSGSFGMAAVLDASLTFGLDLSPTTAIEFAPSVFSPEIVSVSTQIEGGGGGSTSWWR
jgi:hypothetical protein